MYLVQLALVEHRSLRGLIDLITNDALQKIFNREGAVVER